jgi:YD repeat-containing protein
MRLDLRRLAVAVLLCVGFWGSLVSVSTASVVPPGGSASVLSGALVVPDVQSFDENQQVWDALEARRSTPEAFVAREVAQTAYEHLNAAQARRLVARVFPGLIDEPAGGAPSLPADEKVLGYLSDNVAQVSLPTGRRAVVESLEPMALETSPGRYSPIDLAPRGSGDGFQPALPAVSLKIPKRLRDGITLGTTGVSLTPVNSVGAPLAGGEGEVDGATVMYANSVTDGDTLIKPDTLGFSAETLLRGADSPRVLNFRVGMPTGAHLTAVADGVSVVAYGTTIATVLAPTAVDAEGRPVPVTLGVSDAILSVTVPQLDGEYRLPIAVDPTVIIDGIWSGSEHTRTNWEFQHSEGGKYFTAPARPENGTWTETISALHSSSEWGGLFYTTRGASQIIKAHATGTWNDRKVVIQNYLVLYTKKGTEAYTPLPEYAEIEHGGVEREGEGTVCAPALKCSESVEGGQPPENNNTAGYEQESTGPGTKYNGTNTLSGASVEIKQEKGPEIHFNTESPTIYNESTKENIPNVLYGSGGWLGPHSGAFEVKAKDPGLGISSYHVVAPPFVDWREYYAAGWEPYPGAGPQCRGVQCPEAINQAYSYNAEMPNGEAWFEAYAEDPIGEVAYIYPQKIKVDGSPPHITVSGLQNGNELPLGESHLKIEATDGEGTVKSSGVKSITVTVDGHSVAASAASCPEGPCTASTEILLATREYSSGVHSLVVTATDNAGNVAQEEFKFRVAAPAPVSIGPASIDPDNGQLTLSASDVALGGTVGLSRSFDSRELSAGAGGPLGQQWTMNVGGDESLTVLAGGQAVLSTSGGASTTFTKGKTGGYESPKGDSDLKLEAKESEPGKGISYYLVSDPTTGTSTRFEHPAGIQSTSPALAGKFGTEAGQLRHPVSDAVDSAGNVWVTNYGSSTVEKFSPTGALAATYGSYGTGDDQFKQPWGIAIDPRDGNYYVSDQGNNRIEEFSPSGAFIKAFGWGVSKGEAAFESCTTECKAGQAGAGAGEFNDVAGLSVDTSGNLWVADYGNNRIQEFNEKSQYVQAIEKAGPGGGKLEGPADLTFSGGTLYATDYRNNTVEEYSTSGTWQAQFGKAGSGNGEFSGPYGIASDPVTGDIYVADSGNARVQEFTREGAFIVKFGEASEQLVGPEGVAVNALSGIYVVDNDTDDVSEWTRATWFPTEVGGSLGGATTYAYTSIEEESAIAIEPSEALAPVPAGVSCAPKLERGCRALTFSYATATTAIGENENLWGEYKGRLKGVFVHAWNPAKGEMAETEVAHYLYDKQGRLRAEWDPRVTPALKTRYGYGAVDHVTAITAPGQETWAFTYGDGDAEGEPDTLRLLKATQAPATAALWDGKAPENTEKPNLTGSPVVGIRMGVSTGEWTNAPVAYSYEWEDCEKGELSNTWTCYTIPGATNPNYKVQAHDVGFYLRVAVGAINGDGAVEAVSYVSNVPVKSSEAGATEGTHYSAGPGWTVEYGVPASGTGSPYALGTGEVKAWGEKDVPVEGVAIFPPDEPMGWPAADYKRATIHYFDRAGRMVNTVTPGGGIATSEYNSANDVVRTLSADEQVAAMKEKGKEAEAAMLLSTESRYSGETKEEQTHEEEEVKAGLRATVEPGTELLETRGPQHKVKLAEGGAEVLARSHVKYSYDESAPGNHYYGLVTKTTDGAEYEGKEADVRTTRTSYAGQIGIGWELRKPTQTTTDPAGLDLVTKTIYEEGTGNVLETRTRGANSEVVSPPVYAGAFGALGSGNGDVDQPAGIAIGASGYVWVADSANNRVERFKSGKAKGEFGTEGSGDDEFVKPWGIAVSSSGNVFVSDTGNNRIEELSAAGEFVQAFGWGVADGKAELEVCKTGCKAGKAGTEPGQLDDPLGLSVDSNGDVWVANSGDSRVEEFSESGTYHSQLGGPGSGNGQLDDPSDIAIDEGELYVADSGNNRVEEFSPNGVYLSQFGSKGTNGGQLDAPLALAANATTGELFVSDTGNERVEEFSPAGKYLAEFGSSGAGAGEFQSPVGVAVNSEGEVYIVDRENARVETWTPPQAGGAHLIYSTTFGSIGSGNGQLNAPTRVAIDGHGNVWIADTANARIEEFSAAGAFIAAYGSRGSGNGQFEDPVGIAVNQSTGVVYVSDKTTGRVDELSDGEFKSFGSEDLRGPSGLKIDSSGNVWVADTGNTRIDEFSASGEFLQAIGWGVADGKAELETCKTGCQMGRSGPGEGEFVEPVDVTASGADIYVADRGNRRVQELSMSGAYVRSFGAEGTGSGQFMAPEGIAADAAGNVYVVDGPDARVEEFSPSGAFLAQFASYGTGEGQLHGPTGVAIDAAGDMYVADSANNRVERWESDEQAVHDTQMIYYSAAKNKTYSECGKHPEWVGLLCRSQPAAQPEDAPELPVSVLTYNMWDEVETATETFGSITRVKAETYDGVGRALTSETTSTNDKALPKVTNTYNETTGALETQTTETEGKTETITSKLNTLGQLVEYIDADGNTAKYTYDVDGRIEESTEGKGEEATSSRAYSYDPTSGALTKLTDSSDGKATIFTAEYDVEGKMISESYPNGMTAYYTYSPTGQATGLEYVKKTDCTSKCTWLSDSVVPSVHGETLLQISSLATERYTYDHAGRLTEVQEEPAGKACVTRLYAYEEESNRTSLTTREGSVGKCASEGGTVERHTYDSANRLTDNGVTYEMFGNTTSLSAADSGKYALTSTYYVDNQLETQKENGETISYRYDPLGRTRETVAEGKASAKTISHYASGGETVTWSSEGAGLWVRNIAGIDGTLSATQTSGGAVTLQLHDLLGNVVATAGVSETATALLSTYNSTEFGAPQPGTTPPKYAWLGATGLSTETSLSSAEVNPGGASYIPLLGRPLATQSLASPGEFPDGTDGSGVVQASYLQSVANDLKGIAVEQEASNEEAARKRAEEEAAPPCGTACHVDGPGEGNCEPGQCVTIIPPPTEGGAEEEGEQTLAEFHFVPEGGNAAAAREIKCAVAEAKGLPHSSTHTPGYVNWVVGFACDGGIVEDLRIRLALFWEHEEVSETGQVPKGDTALATQSVQSSCITGWYAGWYHVAFVAPPGYVGKTSKGGWSKASRYVTCP